MNIDGVDVHVEGQGDETIIMVHGWPDTYRLWDAQVASLKARYRCVRFTLPGASRDGERRAYSVDEIAEFLRRVVERVSPGRKVILLLHDWGCVFGYQFYVRHPELVSRIVGVDIGDPKALRRALKAGDKLRILVYQVWLALAWKLDGRIGDWMALKMKRWLRSPSDERFVSSRMGFPYYLTWFGGRAFRSQIRRFTPACPMLFVYARRKPVMFHAEAWLDELRKRGENKVVEFDTGHWIMLQQPERFNQVVADWLLREGKAT
jgi:pimeloyl-ACP methyl ester carboxylesterase